MTTMPDDHIRLHFRVGTYTLLAAQLGLEWPPPERIYVPEHGRLREVEVGDEERFVMVRTNMSQFTDAETAKMDHVARGAEYSYLGEVG